MNIICARCKAEMGQDSNLPLTGISCGICEDCFTKQKKEVRKMKKTYNPDYTILLLLAIVAIIGFGVLAVFGTPIILEAIEKIDHLRTF